MFSAIRSLFQKKPVAAPAWTFDQEENVAVFTTTGVLKNGEDIVYVAHDLDDHGWQFHGTSDSRMEDALLVALKEIVAHDPSVLAIGDIPPGWIATRENKTSPWQKLEKLRD